MLLASSERLLGDVEAVLTEVGRRYTEAMDRLLPGGCRQTAMGLSMAVTLPCQDCGRRFPLVGSYELRKPTIKTRRTVRPGSTTLGSRSS